MTDLSRSSPAAQRGSTAPQPRPSLADQLDRLTPRFDDLTQRARLASSVHDYHDIDELADALCNDLRAAVRGRTIG